MNGADYFNYPCCFNFNGDSCIAAVVTVFCVIVKNIIFKEKTDNQKLTNTNRLLESVTVIIPYNGEQDLISDCVKSIVKQSYKGKIETFIVTHYENEESLASTLRSIINSESFINIVHIEKHEKSEKLNHVIKNANSSCIAFLDSDHVADEDWISSAIEELQKNPLWCGVQCIRKPIVKGGIIYAWDSFINHLGNEFINKIRSFCKSNIPFTGTSAVFKTDVFKDCFFENSITEDTDWYFRRFFSGKKTSLKIGYGAVHGTQELMAKDLRTLLSRRIRWSTGHTKAFIDLYKKNKLSHVKNYLELFHGFFFFTSAPFVLFVFLNYFFFFLQMNVTVQAAILLSTLGLPWIINYTMPFKFFNFYLNLLFSFIVLVTLNLVLSGFSNLGLDVIISRDALVMLPGSSTVFFIGATGYTLFIISAIISVRSSIPNSFKIKAILFSAFYIPIEIMAALYGVINSFKNREGKWTTLRNTKQGFFEKITVAVFVIGIVSSVWILMDGRGFKSFFQDLIAFREKKESKKKQIPLSLVQNLKGIAVNSPPNEIMLERFAEIGVNSFRYYKDPGTRWINEAYDKGIYSIIQPSFSNWNHVDVRLPWSKAYLLWNLSYLDSKYKQNPAIPFMVIGNEIELWTIADEKDENKIKNNLEKFYKIFESIQKRLRKTSHHYAIASPFIDTKTSSVLLLPNILNTSPLYWENKIKHFKDSNKLIIAGEWGGFQAPDEAPSEWIRTFRIERQ